MSLKRNEEIKNYYYKYRNNINLGFNSGFVHSSNIVGNMYLPRIMLGLSIGNIGDNVTFAKQEVFPNLYIFL